MNGLLLIDKPPGCTSHDVVQRLRGILSEPRIGHFGTLDPMATGLLVVALGKGPRFFPYYSRENKSYLGRIRLGLATETYDAEGEPVGPESADLPDESSLRRAMAGFEGEIRQIPPPFSAKKFQGKPYYKLARAGAETPQPLVAVRVDRFALLRYEPPEAEVEVICSSGTYVRSLAHDLGRVLGCGGHLSRLRRTACGEFKVEQALPLERVEELADGGRIEEALIPLEALLPGWPRIVLAESDRRLVRTGQALPAVLAAAGSGSVSSGALAVPNDSFRLFSPEGCLIALARMNREGTKLQPFLVIE